MKNYIQLLKRLIYKLKSKEILTDEGNIKIDYTYDDQERLSTYSIIGGSHLVDLQYEFEYNTKGELIGVKIYNRDTLSKQPDLISQYKCGYNSEGMLSFVKDEI